MKVENYCDQIVMRKKFYNLDTYNYKVLNLIAHSTSDQGWEMLIDFQEMKKTTIVRFILSI